MRYFGFVIAAVGFALLVLSFSVEIFTDADAYKQAYYSIDRDELGRDASFEKFYALRDQYLTNKYQYQDYGVTFLVVGLFVAFFTRNGWRRITAMDARWKIVLLGFFSAFLTVAGYVGDLFLEFFRGSYPHWADSLGIPLAGLPILILVFFTWAAINMIGLKGRFIAGGSIGGMGFRHLNWWYGFLTIATLLVVAMCIYDGYFWLALPGLFWCYFYLSVAAGRQSANKLLHQTAVAAVE